MAFKSRHVHEEVGDFHFFVDASFFGEVSDAVFGFDGGFLSQDGEFTGIWKEDRHDHADGCGFPGAVGADEAVHRSLRDGEIDAFDGDLGSEGLADLVHIDCFAHAVPLRYIERLPHLDETRRVHCIRLYRKRRGWFQSSGISRFDCRCIRRAFLSGRGAGACGLLWLRLGGHARG